MLQPNLKLKNKLDKIVIFFSIIIMIFSIIDSYSNNTFLMNLYKITSISYFLVISVYIYQVIRIRNISKRIPCNKSGKYFSIVSDGKDAYLYQKVKKKYRKRRINPIDILNCIFKRYKKAEFTTRDGLKLSGDVRLIRKWIEENPEINLTTYTHTTIAEFLKRYFEIKKGKNGKLSCYNWTKVSIEFRGILIEKPNTFAHYEIKLKNIQ